MEDWSNIEVGMKVLLEKPTKGREHNIVKGVVRRVTDKTIHIECGRMIVVVDRRDIKSLRFESGEIK